MPRFVSHHEVLVAAKRVADQIGTEMSHKESISVYGFPRGGIPPAYLIYNFLDESGYDVGLTSTPEGADVIIDDLIDSGKTRDFCKANYPRARFYALFNKNCDDGVYDSTWLVFPWETTAENDSSGDDIVTRLLQYIGEDVSREGLQETPKRVMKAWRDMTAGYAQDPAALLKTFEDGAEGVDEMITVQNIPVWSLCEHHMLPFFGAATISYIPDREIVGLSKLARVVDAFARRLQVQERLTNQIADLVNDTLKPLGVGVHLRCRHLCMEARGVRTHDSNTVTTALRGVIGEEIAARAEFLNLVNR